MAATAAYTDGLTAFHPALPPLGRLLDALERRHVVVGVERAQHAALLLRELRQRGISLAAVHDAVLWLGPVLCSTARDRAELLEVLKEIRPDPAGAAEPAPETRVVPRLPSEVAREEQAARRRRRGVTLAVLFGLSAIAVLIGLQLIGGLPSVPGLVLPNASGNGQGGTILALLVPVLAAALASGMSALWRLRRAVQQGMAALESLPDPRPTGQGLRWFSETELQSPLRAMARQQRVPGRQIDMPATIRRTVRRAGWPNIVRGGRARDPEHLLLVHLSAPADPQALAAAAVLDRLRGAGLIVHPYSFLHTPNTLTVWASEEEDSLARVAALHRGRRLLVLSDGTPFFDPLHRRIFVPPEFETFAVRVLLTPVPQSRWGMREAVLSGGEQSTAAVDRSFALFEATTAGVSALARWLPSVREPLPLPEPGASKPDFAQLLAADPALFATMPPPAEVRQELLGRLRLFLGDASFDLLRLLAVGPGLPPGTIERVIAHDGPHQEREVDEAALCRLFRLPWFARGALPTWLREDLLRDLPPTLERRARDAWLLHLADMRPGKGALAEPDALRLGQEVAPLLRVADATTRRVLPVAEEASATSSWRSILTAVGSSLLAGLAVLAALVVARLLRMPDVPPTDLFAPLRLLPGLDRFSTVNALVLALAGLPMISRVPRAIAWAAACVAVYVTIGMSVLTLAGEYPVDNDADALRGTTLVLGMLSATVGLVLLGATPGVPRLDLPAALLPGHSWLNVAAAAALVAMAVLFNVAGGNADLELALLVEVGRSCGAVVLILVVLLRDGGGVAAPNRRRWMLRLFGGYALGTGAGYLLPLAIPSGLLPYEGWTLLRGVFDFGLAGMVIAGLSLRPTWPRFVSLAGMTGTYLLYELAIAWMAAPWGLVLLSLPVSLLILSLLLGARPGWRRGSVALLLGIATLAKLLLVSGAGAYALATVWSDGTNPHLAIVAVPEWLLMLPMLRALRPDLAVPSGGLGWSAMLIPLVWIDLSVAGWTFALPPLMVVPVAAWLAHRHGSSALPTIALAIAPMVLTWHGYFGAFSISVGGGIGWGLAGLLTARFVVDRQFRDACFDASRVTPNQLFLLALLPLAYNSPRFGGVIFESNMFGLIVAVCVLIGLSRAPLMAPFLVLATVGLLSMTAIVAGLLPGNPRLGYLIPQPGRAVADLVTVGLALVGSRMARQRESVPAWWHSKPNALGAATIAVTLAAFGFSASLEFGKDLPSQTDYSMLGLSLLGLRDILLLTMIWAAAGVTGPLRPTWPIFSWLPWPALYALPALAVSLIPLLDARLRLGGLFLQVTLLNRSLLSTLVVVLAIVLAWRMGVELRRFLGEAAPASAQGLSRHPVFATPTVRFGVVLVVAPIVALALLVVILLVPL